MMLKLVHKKMTILTIPLGAALAMPVFGQTGVPHSADNTTNPNAQNATNPDAQVPPAAPGTAVGNDQPAIPAQESSAGAASNGSSSFTNAVKDTDITAKVKYALHEDAVTSGSDIHVTTNNGVVKLTGRVRRHRQATKAARIARTTAGVREVVNELEVGRSSSNNG
jgi:hyperosmotically inducible periplasmic protein